MGVSQIDGGAKLLTTRTAREKCGLRKFVIVREREREVQRSNCDIETHSMELGLHGA